MAIPPLVTLIVPKNPKNVKNVGINTEMYPYLPDLLALQLESFRFFLEKGLLEELENGFQGITTSQGTLVVNAKDYKLLRPRYPPEVCVEKMQTYDARLYVPCAILGRTPAKMPTMPYYCLGKIPLLTDRGNFLINGVRRVLLNQMVRCPNIYYKVHLLPKVQGNIHPVLI